MVMYADGPTAVVEVEVAASADVLWSYITDIDVPARFSKEFQGARWMSGAGPCLGAVFEGTNRHERAGTWTTLSTVTTYEEESVFEWTVGDIANKVARWRFELEPAGPSCVLRFSAEMGPGPSGITGIIKAKPDREEDIVANRLGQWEANMTLTVAGIKELAEAN